METNFEKGAFFMSTTYRPARRRAQSPYFRIWVDTERKIVSFHEEEGCQMLEFTSREMFLRCVDQYTSRQFRYQ